jgi:hypothetical protein
VSVRLLSVVAVVVLGGCVVTSELSGTEPAPFCSDEGCKPGTTNFSEPWGPLDLSGGISLTNVLNIAAWATDIDDAIETADQVVRDQLKAYECGPSCKKDWSMTRTLQLTVNGDAPGPACSGASFTTSIKLKGSGVTCWLAKTSMVNGVNQAAADLDAKCAEMVPGCTAGLIKVDYDWGYNVIETETAFWCDVEATADVTVQCSGDAGGISSPSASGVVKATVACSADNRCPITPGHQTDQDARDAGSDASRDAEVPRMSEDTSGTP